MEIMDSSWRSEGLEELMVSMRIKAKRILRAHQKPNLDVAKKKAIMADLCMGSK